VDLCSLLFGFCLVGIDKSGTSSFALPHSQQSYHFLSTHAHTIMNDPTTTTGGIGSLEDAVLAPYLEAAASSKNPGAIRAVVNKVLADSDLFAGYDQVKAAIITGGNNDSNEGVVVLEEKLSDTLDLFSYGTLTDYYQQQLQSPENCKYLPLNEPQLAKLRQLTVLSLIESACQQRQNTVSYATIQQALQMVGGDDPVEKNRATELLLSQLLAARVVTGKLSQKQQAFRIGGGGSSDGAPMVRPRDVHPSEVPNMILAVQRLRSKLHESNAVIVEQQNRILAAFEQEKKEMRQAEAKWKDNGGGSGPFDPMDLEGTSARAAASRRTKRSRGGFTNSLQETLGGIASHAFGMQM